MIKKNLLDLYSDYLISAFGQTAATGLSALLNSQISHDSVQHFLAGDQQSSADLWCVVKPHIRAIERQNGVLIIDDSISEKSYAAKTTLSAGIMLIKSSVMSNVSTLRPNYIITTGFLCH